MLGFVMAWQALRRRYRNALWELAQFERGGAWLHGTEAALVFLIIPTLPLAALIGGVYVADTHTAQLALGLLLIAATTTSGWLWKRRLWERPVLARLERWHTSDPRNGEVGVAIADADIQRACVALMRARLYPRYSRRANPIPDAPALDYYLAVVLPAILPQVEFDVVAERTRNALRDADIRARVVGIDVP
jgi:hypothetical protein